MLELNIQLITYIMTIHIILIPISGIKYYSRETTSELSIFYFSP